MERRPVLFFFFFNVSCRQRVRGGGGGWEGRGRRGNEIGRDFLHPLLLRCTQLRMMKTAVPKRLGLFDFDRTRGILTGENNKKEREKPIIRGNKRRLAPRGQIEKLTACIVRSCTSS